MSNVVNQKENLLEHCVRKFLSGEKKLTSNSVNQKNCSQAMHKKFCCVRKNFKS